MVQSTYAPTSTALQGLTIKPRNLIWDFSNVPRIWCKDNPELTHFLNTFSIIAPVFEDWAVPLMRKIVDEIDHPELKKEAKAFIGQEAHHSRAHKIFNEMLVEKHGYDLSAVESKLNKLMSWVAKKPIQMQMAILVAGEHFLANIGDWYINEDEIKVGMDENGNRLLTWHLAEEIEHTAVAHDVYEYLYGKNISSHVMKCRAYSLVSVLLTKEIPSMWQSLVRQDIDAGRISLEPHRIRLYYPPIAKTLMTFGAKYFGRYASYFNKNFSPWDHNSNVDKLPALLKAVGTE